MPSASSTNSFGMFLGRPSGSFSSQKLIASRPKSLSRFVYILEMSNVVKTVFSFVSVFSLFRKSMSSLI